jgi:hypothetical protein
MSLNPIVPMKIGIRFDPSAVILFYKINSKKRKRIIPTRSNLDILTNVSLYVENLKKNPNYIKYFERVSHNTLEKMIFILQDHMKGYNLNESLNRAKKYNEDEKINYFSEEDAKNSIMQRNNDNDFHDTDDDDKQTTPSVSTIDEVLKMTEKDKKRNFNQKSIKTRSIDYYTLQSQFKEAESNIKYDFDEDDDEITNKNSYEKVEIDPNADFSDSSF